MQARSASAARVSPIRWIALVLVAAAAIGAQVAFAGALTRPQESPDILWFRSTAVMRRAALGFTDLLADVYWIRAVQYYGDTKLSTNSKKTYESLYPLLDMSTTLDPHFNIAYRFGAILLSEGPPNGPGKTDEAIALLEKGIKTMPDKWQYYHDAGFVEYWWHADRQKAGQWFLRGADLPGSPAWLRPVAASMMAEGGSRDSARALWSEIAATAEHDWLRQAARRGLMQLDAETAIDLLQPIVNRYHDEHDRFPESWDELVRAGRLRAEPTDPTGHYFTLDPISGVVDVDRYSPLAPLPGRGRR